MNPFFTKRGISLRIRNFESEHLKVNDLAGNPIEIAAVVVWHGWSTRPRRLPPTSTTTTTSSTSRASVGPAEHGTSYHPYDVHVEGEISLRSHTAEVAEHLKTEIQDRLAQAGVEVLEARISHLAYAPGRDRPRRDAPGGSAGQRP